MAWADGIIAESSWIIAESSWIIAESSYSRINLGGPARGT
jgi:hypothetical protein